MNENNIVEAVPSMEEWPDWAVEAFRGGNFFRECIEKVAHLEQLIKRHNDGCEEACTFEESPTCHQKRAIGKTCSRCPRHLKIIIAAQQPEGSTDGTH